MRETSSSVKRSRMTRSERREQLIAVSRELFACHGFDAISIEEIATQAGVTKPVIYEHFGGKEGLYQVIVDRELSRLSLMLTEHITPGQPVSLILKGIVVAILDYADDEPNGFRLLTHQSPSAVSSGRFSTVMYDVAEEVSALLEPQFDSLGLAAHTAPLYGQMLAGAVANAALWWSATRTISKEEAAAHVTNLIYHGLHAMRRNPTIP